MVGFAPGNIGDGRDGVNAGVTQGLDEIGVEGIEQGGIKDARLAVVDNPDVEEGNIVEVSGWFCPHMQEGHKVLVVDV